MLRSRSTNNRASSAGLGSQKKERILSGKPLRKMQRIHTQSYEVKSTKPRLLTSGMEHKLGETSCKGDEELVDENMQLKLEVKQLNARLNLTRTKIQFQKKKHLTYSRKLNREFQKQLYWPSDKCQDYLITGIKHQYQKAKQSLQRKSVELQLTRQTIAYTSLAQLTAYCDSLQVENKILIENISYLKKKNRRTSSSVVVDNTYVASVGDNNNNHVSSVGNNKKYAAADLEQLIAQERNKNQRSQSIIKTLQQQISKNSLTQRQHIKKIHFLEKLIIEKQNQSYHMRKQMKETERHKLKLINQVKLAQNQMLEKQRCHQQQFSEFKQKAERQANVEKVIYSKSVKQKNLMIQKLEKQIAYLSTLLSYWKPLDELDRPEVNNSCQKSHKDNNGIQKSQKDNKSINPNLNQSMSVQGTNNRDMVRSKTPINFNLNVDQENYSHDQGLLIRASQKEDSVSRRDSSLRTIQREESDRFTIAEGTTNREPRRSTKKWSQEAKKNRRVQFAQVQHLGQLIRYKMIGAQKPLTQLKDYFRCKPKPTATKLDQQLIAMKQVNQTLTQPPFSLPGPEAALLSRYIIQDSGAEYVYTHQQNQLQRLIVNSVVRSIVGQYSLPEPTQSQQKWLKIKTIYSQNMHLALKSICPKGTVTKNKFLELINSLGIQADQQTKDYILATMVAHSSSLYALPYDCLFHQTDTIN